MNRFNIPMYRDEAIPQPKDIFLYLSIVKKIKWEGIDFSQYNRLHYAFRILLKVFEAFQLPPNFLNPLLTFLSQLYILFPRLLHPAI